MNTDPTQRAGKLGGVLSAWVAPAVLGWLCAAFGILATGCSTMLNFYRRKAPYHRLAANYKRKNKDDFSSLMCPLLMRGDAL